MNYKLFLFWLLGKLDLIPVLAGLAQTVVTGSLEEKWAALKAIGDTILPALKDMPSVLPAGIDGASEAELETQLCEALRLAPTAQSAGALAWDGSRIKAIWSVVGPLIPVLIGLLK